jgi:hypothetical protein
MKVELRPFANGGSSGAFDYECYSFIAILATGAIASGIGHTWDCTVPVADRIPLQSLTRRESRGYSISVLSDPHPDRLSVSSAGVVFELVPSTSTDWHTNPLIRLQYRFHDGP